MVETSPSWNLATLIFRAAWPYWEGSSEQTVEIGQGETETTWFPFLPLVLGASDAFASFTIDNTGDVPAWPLVTCHRSRSRRDRYESDHWGPLDRDRVGRRWVGYSRSTRGLVVSK